MDWTSPDLDAPPEPDTERWLSGRSGAIRLARAGTAVWLEVGGHAALPIDVEDIDELFEEPALAAGGSDTVIAAPPVVYLVFGRGTLGLCDVTTGDYRLTWLDLAHGRVGEADACQLDGGEEQFESPLDPGDPVVLILTRIGR